MRKAWGISDTYKQEDMTEDGRILILYKQVDKI